MRDREALNIIRKEQNLTYEALGDLVGKTRTVVCEQLREKVGYSMTLSVLVEYADALGYSIVLMEKKKAKNQRFVLDEYNKSLRNKRYAKRREKLLAELEMINRELDKEE